jgi:photosystem II stability/assembly factor-like uncharacterized protein
VVPIGLPSISLAIDPHRHQRVYATNAGSFYVTDNAGLTWNRSETGLHGINLVSVVADLIHPGTFYGSNFATIYATTDFGATWSKYPVPTSDTFMLGLDARHRRLSFVTGHAVPGRSLGYSSTNGGRTWHASHGLQNADAVMSLGVAPGDPRTMYAGTYNDGIFKSRNGGGSWRLLRAGPIGPAVTGLAVDPTTAATVYAGVSGVGVMKTTNGGVTWNAMGSGLPPNVEIGEIAVDPHDVSTVYAAAWAFGRVFKTTDAGGSWSEVSTGLPQGAAFINAVSGLLVDPVTPGTVYASMGTSGIFRSTDGGATWSDFNLGMPAPAGGLIVGPGSTIYTGTSQGLFRLVTP